MNRALRLASMALALCMAVSTPAAAQERLFAFYPVVAAPQLTMLAEIGTAPGELGVVKRVLRPPDDFHLAEAAPVAGGRYLALMSSLIHTFGEVQLYFFDLRTGAVLDTGARFFGGTIVASDPRVPRLFIRKADSARLTVVTVDPFTVSELEHEFPAGSGGEGRVAYAPDGSWLLRTGAEHAIDVIDLSTGRLARTIPRSPRAGIAVDDAGTLYVGRAASADAPVQIHAINLATGDVKASAPFALPMTVSTYDLVLDEARRRLMVVPSVCVGCAPEPTPLGVLNADTLALEVAVPQSAFASVGPLGAGQSAGMRLHTSARGDAYFAWLTREVPGTPSGEPDPQCLHHSVTRVDPNTGALLEQADMRKLSAIGLGAPRFCPSAYYIQLNAPARPTLSADVQGNTVTLSWANPGNTGHFDLEAGSAPGLRNLLMTSLTDTSFSVSGVPPGTYYLRVRAINEVGRSLPSNEVQVVLP